MPASEDSTMGGGLFDITHGDRLVWTGLAFLVVLCVLSALAPRMLNGRRTLPDG
jgi:hypothetical protein